MQFNMVVSLAKGIGEGILKERIPESHIDYVLASISEEYGIIVIILILIIIFSFVHESFCYLSERNFKLQKIYIGYFIHHYTIANIY